MLYSKENCKKLTEIAEKIAESEPIDALKCNDAGPYDVVRCGQHVGKLSAHLLEVFDAVAEWYPSDYQALYEDQLNVRESFTKNIDGRGYVAKLERVAAILLIDIARMRKNLELHPDYQ